MPKFTDEQVERAKNTDVREFLEQTEGYTFEGHGRFLKCQNPRRTNQPSSLSVDTELNRIFYNSMTGNRPLSAVDWCMKIKDMDFQSSMRLVLGENPQGERVERPKFQQHRVQPKSETAKEKNLELSEKSDTSKNVYMYLTQTRGIPKNIVNDCLNQNLIYQDVRKNAVFVGYDSDGKIPKYAARRGTFTPEGKEPFKRDCTGSDKNFAFRLEGKNTETVYVAEAAIDVLSLAALEDKFNGVGAYKNKTYLSTGGAGIDSALEQFCKTHNVKTINVCFDDDEAGKNGMEKIMQKFRERGITVNDMRASMAHDYNDELVAFNNDPNFYSKPPDVVKAISENTQERSDIMPETTTENQKIEKAFNEIFSNYSCSYERKDLEALPHNVQLHIAEVYNKRPFDENNTTTYDISSELDREIFRAINANDFKKIIGAEELSQNGIVITDIKPKKSLGEEFLFADNALNDDDIQKCFNEGIQSISFRNSHNENVTFTSYTDLKNSLDNPNDIFFHKNIERVSERTQEDKAIFSPTLNEYDYNPTDEPLSPDELAYMASGEPDEYIPFDDYTIPDEHYEYDRYGYEENHSEPEMPNTQQYSENIPTEINESKQSEQSQTVPESPVHSERIISEKPPVPDLQPEVKADNLIAEESTNKETAISPMPKKDIPLTVSENTKRNVYVDNMQSENQSTVWSKSEPKQEKIPPPERLVMPSAVYQQTAPIQPSKPEIRQPEVRTRPVIQEQPVSSVIFGNTAYSKIPEKEYIGDISPSISVNLFNRLQQENIKFSGKFTENALVVVCPKSDMNKVKGIIGEETAALEKSSVQKATPPIEKQSSISDEPPEIKKEIRTAEKEPVTENALSEMTSSEKTNALLASLKDRQEAKRAGLLDKIDTINSKIADRQERINKLNDKISDIEISLKTAAAFKRVFGNTAVGNLIDKSIARKQAKIKEIREIKIPKQSDKINAQRDKKEKVTNKLAKVNRKIDKLDKVQDFLSAIGSKDKEQRHKGFVTGLENLSDIRRGNLNNKLNKVQTKIDMLSAKISSPELSNMERLNLSREIRELKGKSADISLKVKRLDKLDSDLGDMKDGKFTEAEIDTVVSKTAGRISERLDNADSPDSKGIINHIISQTVESGSEAVAEVSAEKSEIQTQRIQPELNRERIPENREPEVSAETERQIMIAVAAVTGISSSELNRLPVEIKSDIIAEFRENNGNIPTEQLAERICNIAEIKLPEQEKQSDMAFSPRPNEKKEKHERNPFTENKPLFSRSAIMSDKFKPTTSKSVSDIERDRQNKSHDTAL